MVRREGRTSTGRLLVPVALAALLLLLAGLQYRWTGEVSRAEAERMEASLRLSVQRFGEDVDEELARVFRAFHVRSEEELVSALTDWRSDPPELDLVDDVFLERPDGWYEIGPNGARPANAPAELSELGRPTVRGLPRGREIALPAISADPPVLAIPLAPPRGRRHPRAEAGRVVVELDEDLLRNQLLSDASRRYFEAGRAPGYEVVVVDSEGETVWASPGAEPGRVLAAPDAVGRLFSLGRRWSRSDFAPPPGLDPRARPLPIRELARELTEGQWTVFVRHEAGSVEAAIGRVRRRNLAVSFGILGLLGASVALVAASARRAVELGNRKVEFVAGVSHELRTPLAVIRSAAQNLADGSVTEPDHVKRYGSLVDAEGRRLETLVEEVLELAGAQSQSQSQARRDLSEAVSVTDVVEAAVSESEGLARDASVEVAVTFPDRDLTVPGDSDALRRAVSNLVVNAVKHAGGATPIEVRVEERGDEVAVVVSDRGPGIEESEVPHLFEAFYRGRRARERQVSGSGLGLSLVDRIVRQHGGRVDVSTRPGKGSRFAIVLPRAPEPSP